MQGKIVKGIAGFYYVNTKEDKLYECKAKGVFRNKSQKPLVGDNVCIDIIDEEELKGNITKLLPRKNELIRPTVANVDLALVVFAISNPKPNLNLLDKFLVMMEYMDVKTIICFNKVDETTKSDIEDYKKIYEPAGYKVLFTSTYNGEGIDELKSIIKGKTIVFAGPSGVGKSSILNSIMDDELMDTGEISKKIGRGKHTTRHSEIFRLGHDTYIFDTPGFSTIFVPQIDENNLRFYYPEFAPYENQCKYNGCVHVNEPGCALKEAIESGEVSKVRYENYKEIFEELKNNKKY